jgi:DNA primase
MVSASVKLTRRGRAHWGICPLHSPDKTGSFKVEAWRGKERFHCFGCHASGDAVDWLRITQNVGYLEAKRILGEEPAKPDPAIIAARQAEQHRQTTIRSYRDRNPECDCPDWLIAT